MASVSGDEDSRNLMKKTNSVRIELWHPHENGKQQKSCLDSTGISCPQLNQASFSDSISLCLVNSLGIRVPDSIDYMINVVTMNLAALCLVLSLLCFINNNIMNDASHCQSCIFLFFPLV